MRKTLERWKLLETGSPQSEVFEKFRVSVKKGSIKSRHPVMAMANFLNYEPHDLIVLATGGREGLDRWVDRSDAEAIARWSRTMTLFVPEHAKRGIVSLQDGDLSLRNILVPVDRHPDCTAAIEIARRSAEILGDDVVNITLLHVGDTQAPNPVLLDGSDWKWQKEHRRGEPVAEILSAADAYTADLIVMATVGHDSVLDALRGSTTEQVLRRAPCPLLAVPAKVF